MKLRIQRTINWLQYSTNEQIIDTEGLTPEEVKAQIQQAKTYADIIQNTMTETVVVQSSQADHQMVSEFTETKKVLEKVQTLSEQKSVLLEAFKTILWEDVYTKHKEEIMASPHFKKITLHSSETE